MKRMICILALILLSFTIAESGTVSAKILSSSKTNVTVTKGQKTSVNITYKKSGKIYYENFNTDVIKASWGKKWNGYKIKLNIKGKKVGKTKIIVTNSKNKEKVTINVKVKKKDKLNSKVRKRLRIPKNATYKVSYNKYFWSGGPCYLMHVCVEGTGKYKGYVAYGDFSLDYGSSKSVFRWEKID